MAIKYYCDGCDKEVPYDLIQKLSVTVKPSGQVSSAGGEFELCKRCADDMIRDCNPRNWTRVHEAPPKRTQVL